MSNEKLAIHGGRKSRVKPFPAQPGPDMEQEYLEPFHTIMQSRILSGYRGNASPAFYGGEQVQAFEKDLEEKFGGTAIACNSATSGLWMACAAIGLQPGDEVIVTPWSMSCSATVPLLFGAIPVFADIEPDKFCLDPVDVERKITDRTKAIIAVDLFGQPYDGEINRIAEENDLYVIEDAAQAIGSTGLRRYKYETRGTDTFINGERFPAGRIGHISVFSFTQGKHMTSGEGGACITDDPVLAHRLAMLRNHAESVTNDDQEMFPPAPGNGVGLNLRMTEIQAAIMREELRRLDSYIDKRRGFVEKFKELFKETGILSVAPTRDGCTHSYYVLPFLLDLEYWNYAAEIAEALRAELMPDEIRIDRGVPISAGYIKPLYLFPVFQNRNHWAFSLKENEGNSGKYTEGTCTNAELLQKGGLIITLLHGLDLQDGDFEDIANAFRKALNYYKGKWSI